MPHQRLTATQKFKMITFLEKEENKCLVNGATHFMDAGWVNKRWEKLSLILNSCGSGPQKSAAKWRKTFNELKCAIKKKQRAILADNMATSGVPLSDLEIRFLNLFRKNSVEGEPSTGTLGFSTPPLQEKMESDAEDSSEEKGSDSFVNSPEEIFLSSTPQPKCEKEQSQSVNKEITDSAQNVVDVLQMQAEAMNSIASALHKMADSQQAMTGKVINVCDEVINTLKTVNNYIKAKGLLE